VRQSNITAWSEDCLHWIAAGIDRQTSLQAGFEAGKALCQLLLWTQTFAETRRATVNPELLLEMVESSADEWKRACPEERTDPVRNLKQYLGRQVVQIRRSRL
jgi:hypothetical protein